MQRSARVTSIDALATFRLALQKYEEVMSDVLAMLLLEVRRAVDWIEQDRTTYWPAEVRRANESVIEALNRLERKQISFDPSDHPSCHEEKKGVEQARRRLRYTEEKVVCTRHWLRVIRHEAEEFQGLLAKVGQLVESDLPRAIAALDHILDSLAKYTETPRPADPLPGPTSNEPSAAPQDP